MIIQYNYITFIRLCKWRVYFCLYMINLIASDLAELLHFSNHRGVFHSSIKDCVLSIKYKNNNPSFRYHLEFIFEGFRELVEELGIVVLYHDLNCNTPGYVIESNILKAPQFIENPSLDRKVVTMTYSRQPGIHRSTLDPVLHRSTLDPVLHRSTLDLVPHRSTLDLVPHRWVHSRPCPTSVHSRPCPTSIGPL